MSKTFLMITSGLALALTHGLAGAQAASAPMGGMSHGSQQMHEQMMAGMQKMQSMQSTGDVDKDFAAMMRMHHEQAVGMAKAEAEHGKSPELKAMARKMMKDQQEEIQQLDRWLQKHP